MFKIGLRKTGKNGTAIWTGLTAGTYIVEELDPADGYSIIQSSETVYLADSGTQSVVSVRFENAPDGILLIRKVCAVNPSTTLRNAEFKVMYADGTLIGDANGIYRTDENGEIRIEGLKPNKSIIVTETQAPDGYLIDTQSQTIQTKPGRTVTLTFKNQPKGALIIQKRDSVTNQPLSGVEFRVTTAAGCEVGLDGVIGNSTLTQNGIFTTDANGEIRISKLAPGAYVLTEIKTVDGYVIDTPSTNVVIGKNGDTQTVVIKNTPKGTLTIVKLDSSTGKPLPGVTFRVTTSTGAVIGGSVASNGYYKTDVNGTITISGIEPDTYMITETEVPAGYVLSGETKVVRVDAAQHQTVTFGNLPKGNLMIRKIDSVTKLPVSGAEFKVTKSDGSVVATAGGQISSNGIYTTDENGEIHITLVDPATYVVTETKAPDGYILDSTPQTVVVDANDTQTLTFTNTPIGGLQIIKSDESSGKRISGVQFEVRKENGQVIGQYTTDRNGVILLPELDSGWYVVTELKAASGYLLDTTPQHIEVKDGKTATLELTNHKTSNILLHKVDSATGKGIYGATFLLYDSNHNPIGQYTTDQNGYIYVDEGLEDGRYYIREIKAADGYILDEELKTIYVKYGETSEIRWENTAVRGQIQIIKKSANDNSINGLPAGSLLEGAVFEIYDKAGNTVDTIRTDRNGRAVSKLLPLSRYTIREVSAPAYYSVNPAVMTAYLEYQGQIVTFEVQDESVATGVAIRKTGPKEVMPGQPIKYTFSGIANTSLVPLGSFYWRDKLPAYVIPKAIYTGTYNQQLAYKVVFKTNFSGDTYRTLADNLSTSKNYKLDISPKALRLAANEKVTEVMFVFGQVKAGFAQVETPYIHGTVSKWLSNGATLVNVADVGGLYNGMWIQAVSRWVTNVYAKTVVKLPKTGY